MVKYENVPGIHSMAIHKFPMAFSGNSDFQQRRKKSCDRSPPYWRDRRTCCQRVQHLSSPGVDKPRCQGTSWKTMQNHIKYAPGNSGFRLDLFTLRGQMRGICSFWDVIHLALQLALAFDELRMLDTGFDQTPWRQGSVEHLWICGQICGQNSTEIPSGRLGIAPGPK